jgi:uncharacterized membrane protein YfcA
VPTVDLLLVGVAFATSALTAVTGIGGGLLLISVMGQFLTPAAALPVHGIVQLGSNVSRAAFGWRDVRWELAAPYALGAALGAAIGSQVVVALEPAPFSILLGTFVLVLTWMPRLEVRRRLLARGPRFGVLGAVVTFLSMFVGAIGPVSAPFFLREGLERDELVVTHATCLSSVHLFKVAGFFVAGFALAPHLALVLAMLVATTLGSWAGTRWRGRVDERVFRHVFRWLVTLLGANLILRAALS